MEKCIIAIKNAHNMYTTAMSITKLRNLLEIHYIITTLVV